MEFNDRTIKITSAKIIAENIMVSQIYEQGHKQPMIDEIIDHVRSHQYAIKKTDDFVSNPNNKAKKEKDQELMEIVCTMERSNELSAEDITFYQEIIWMLRWAIEIGQVDISLEVSLLSSNPGCTQDWSFGATIT